MLDFDTALERVLGVAHEHYREYSATERVGLEAASGRVLACDVVSSGALPALDTSAMDGYAVRSSDFSGKGPWRWRLLGECRTGHETPPWEGAGCLRIFTGAGVPSGADSVVMQENVEQHGEHIVFTKRPRPFENVRRAGEDLAQGTLALARGTRLTGFQLGLLAALERVELEVARRPRVTILCTGDELRPPGHPGGPGLAESNGVALSALVEALGGVAQRAPVARDEKHIVREALSRAVRGADLVLTVGGVSVGDHDLVRPVLDELGASTEFWKVAMKPGKPIVLSRLGAALVLGLPGNPASALVTFALFGAPLLRVLQGDARPRAPGRRAMLTQAVAQKPGRRGFLRAELVGTRVTPLANQSSGANTTLAWANALIVVPESVEQLEAGVEVDVVAFSEL